MFGSGSLAETLAVFVMVPTAVGMTIKVLVVVMPGPKAPRSNMTVFPDWLTDPAVVVADTKFTPSANVSVIVTAVDVAAPTLVTVSV